MKQGTTLQNLSSKLITHEQAKKDFAVDTRKLEFDPKDRTLTLDFGETKRAESVAYDITHHATRQIGRRLHIPARFWDRLEDEHPALLGTNVNYLFQNAPETRMVRTLFGRVRAFLSDSYRRIDNYDVMDAVLPILRDSGRNFTIASCALTEKKLYFKVVFPELESDVRVGDRVQSGFVLSNSEIGAGSLRVQPLVYRLVCDNGLIAHDRSIIKRHVGSKLDQDAGLARVLSDETKRHEDEGVLMKVRDIVESAMDEEMFEELVEALRETTKRGLSEPEKTIEQLGDTTRLTEDEQSGILWQLAQEGDLTQWGVTNAITRHSQDVEDYDRATELEEIGGKVAAMGDKQWEAVAV